MPKTTPSPSSLIYLHCPFLSQWGDMARAHMFNLLLHSPGKLEGRTRSQTTEAAASQWSNSNMAALSQKGQGMEKGKKSEGHFPCTGIFFP